MSRRLSRRKLEEIQHDLWLAELVRETEDSLLITLAGDGRVLAFDLQGVVALAVAHESLDPWLLPAEVEPSRPLVLVGTVDFEPEDEIAARLVELGPDQFADLVAASRIEWLRGSSAAAMDAPFLVDLRVENWGAAESRSDLHVLVAAREFLAVEDDEIDLAPGDDEGGKADSGTITSHEAPAEPAFQVAPHDLLPELEAPLRVFFEAQLEDDFDRLVEVWPAHDLRGEERLLHLRRHFHDLEDWGYARAIEGWKREGDLAAVRVRGISHSAPEDGIRALNEECLWTFSLRRRGGDWIIRGWSRGWPSVGGAPCLPPDAKPWLAAWTSGPVLDD